MVAKSVTKFVIAIGRGGDKSLLGWVIDFEELVVMQRLYAIKALARKEKYDAQQRLELRQADAALSMRTIPIPG